MIRLDVKPYCQNCRRFKPTVNTDVSLDMNGKIMFVDSVVTCVRADECRCIHKYIQKEVAKNGTESGS